ncbi:MAG: hypothetical protein AB4372_10550 [Xenococcus sp. (in: cyanobacteria)]
MSKSTTRSCRKCRNHIELSLLKKIGDRWYCKDGCQWWTKARQQKKKQFAPERKIYTDFSGERFVITAAQNNTYINEPFFESLQYYCSAKKAKLIVIPFRYRNPTTPDEEVAQEGEEWYDPRITDYIEDSRISFNGITILADIKIRPTAVNPLSGLESLANGKSAITGHPQIALKTIPTAKGKIPLLLTTTGAVTLKNYSESKAGKKGEFHHSFGAVTLELRENNFHLRHLNATRDGSFIDLGVEYRPTQERPATTEALIMGDLHIGQSCPQTILATMRLINKLSPEKIVLHDSFDGDSVNHHENHNPFAKFNHSFCDVLEELDINAKILKHYASLCKELVIVNSNHNDFLYRWLQRTDWKCLSPKVAQFYLKSAIAVSRDLDSDIYGKEMIERGVKATFLELDQSYKVQGIELGFHGHTGANGSRASSKQYARTGSKTVIGHQHQPSIVEGCYTVGTSTYLSLGYTKGLSSWLNTHCLIYENGKRQLIHLIEGEF